MTTTFVNLYNHVAKRIISNWVTPETEDNDATKGKLHICTITTNETTCKFFTDENGDRHYDSGWDVMYFAIYDPKTRKVVECGKYDTGKKMNGMGSLPDYGKMNGFCKGHGRYSSIFHAPIAGKKDNHEYLVGEGEAVEMINKYCFEYYNRKK